MEGGELFNRIQERADSAFTERGMYNIIFWSLKKKPWLMMVHNYRTNSIKLINILFYDGQCVAF